ncbi:MarR family transcriptional regulator [Pseudomonas chlororaphis subsp. piscium]|nr:MarR family transcriptional regulator [Pseudomonas chlororaphis subsp. piscium]
MNSYCFSTAVPYLVTRVGVRMGECFSQELGEHGLTLVMYRVLAVLREQGGLSLGELGGRVSAEISTLSRQVTNMQKLGLILRERQDANGRQVCISLTPRGWPWWSRWCHGRCIGRRWPSRVSARRKWSSSKPC